MKQDRTKAKELLNQVYDIMRECSYEYNDCDTAEDCIENLIQDIKDNIGDYITDIFG